MGKERRGFGRARLDFSMRYKRVGALMDLWHRAALTDISAGGLRFATDELMDEGSKLEFEVILPIRKDPYLLIGRVVSEQEGEYGVVLLDVPPDKQVEVDELVEFLNRPKGQTSAEGG